MRPGISKLVVRRMPHEEFFEAVAAAGYEVVELLLGQEGELTLATPPAQIEGLVESARRRGLEIVSMTHSHCTGNLLESGDAQRESIEQTIAGMHVASRLGVGCTLHTLGKLRPDLYYDDAYRNGVASLKQIAPVCEQLGIDLAVEFIWSGFLFSPMEMRRFLDEIGSPRIGFYFDPGNMAIFQYPHHWVRIVGDRVRMVHLKDWKGRGLRGEWTPLLEGEVDFAAINRELRAIGYDGPMISEVSPGMASLEQTCEAIRRIIQM